MSQQIQITGGAKVRDLQDVIIGTSGVLTSLGFDVANGVPRLDVNGKILVSQLPNSVMEYKGTWNAATNTPTLVNGTGNQGDVYLCNVAGTVDFGAGAIAFVVGDQVIYSGSIWQRASGATGTVTSVAVTESGDSLNITGSPINTSGTINIGFNGTNLQYVNGAGNLTTFPILTGYVPYTGATQDVDLDVFSLNAKSLHIKGTAGNGHLGLKHQSAAATGSANESLIYADTLGDLSWLNGNLYLSKFIISGNTAARSYTFPNANGTVALTSDLTGYLTAVTATSPLSSSGGTTPNITIAQATTSANGYLSSTDWNTFNNKQAAITLTTTGSSGVSTLVGATLNIPDYGSALTGYVTLATTQTITGAKTFSGYTTFTSTVDITSGLTFSNSGFTLVLQPPTLSVNRTVTLPNGTGTLALTSDISYPVTSVFGRTGAVVATSGDYTTAQVTESGNLYFTDSRARLAISLTTTGTSGAATYNNTTGVFNIPNYAPDLSGYVTLAGTQTITGAKTFSTFTKFDGGVILKNNVSASLAGYVGISAYSASGNKGINIDFDTYSNSFYFSGTLPYQYTFPAASGTIALVGGSGVGTVTSVAALTIGTSGTDLSSSVANSTTTPVITLNVPTASATNRGALSSADWSTFNNKQSALTNPVTGTGTTNYLPKFTGASAIGNSAISDDGSSAVLITSRDVILSNSSPLRGYTTTAAAYRLISIESDNNIYIAGNGGNILMNGGGNVGIGTATPATNYILTLRTQSADYTKVLDWGTAAGGSWGNMTINISAPYQTILNSGAWQFNISGTQKMLLDNSGNLGLGVTPSAWSGFTALDISNVGCLAAYPSFGVALFRNAYYDGSVYRYKITSAASYYDQDSNGQHIWYKAPSGTAGNAITFTQAMTLFSTGNLAVGTTTDSGYKLDVNGTGRFSGALFVADGGNTTIPCLKISTTTTGISSASSEQLNFITNSVTRLTIASTGAATFSSSVTATGFFESSDSRLKTLIQDNYQTKGIALITPKLYTKNGKVELGYYAQDFVGILDSAVSKGSDDMLSLSYREVLVAKVYALEQRIKELETK
jgi:hypothetical protein